MDAKEKWSVENPIGSVVRHKQMTVHGKVVSEAFYVPGRHHVLVELEDGGRHALPIEVLVRCENLPNGKRVHPYQRRRTSITG